MLILKLIIAVYEAFLSVILSPLERVVDFIIKEKSWLRRW